MLRRNKNESPDQLMLDFEKSRDDMKVAVDKFGEAAAKLAESHDNPETAAMVGDDMKETRRVINRLVGVLASQTGLKFRDVWVLAYHEMYNQTGFHAVAASGGKGTHLDAVAGAGKLPDLRATVAGMLTDERFGPGGKA